MLKVAIFYSALKLLNAVGIDEIKKVFVITFVDDLGKQVWWEFEHARQFIQRQFGIDVWFVLCHVYFYLVSEPVQVFVTEVFVLFMIQVASFHFLNGQFGYGIEQGYRLGYFKNFWLMDRKIPQKVWNDEKNQSNQVGAFFGKKPNFAVIKVTNSSNY